MNTLKKTLLAAAALALLGTSAAEAGSYRISVTTGLIGSGFETLSTPPAFSGQTASASFTYTGDLNFNNPAPQNGPSEPRGDLNRAFGFDRINITKYSGSGTVTFQGTQVANFTDEVAFLRSSGSVGGYGYASLYTIALNTISAGTNLTITHDDGISLYRMDGNTLTRVPGGASGPTSVVTDTFSNLAAGKYTLFYSRQNGTPSVLQVAVPEPASLAIFGAGLLGLGYVRRRRANQAA